MRGVCGCVCVCVWVCVGVCGCEWVCSWRVWVRVCRAAARSAHALPRPPTTTTTTRAPTRARPPPPPTHTHPPAPPSLRTYRAAHDSCHRRSLAPRTASSPRAISSNARCAAPNAARCAPSSAPSSGGVSGSNADAYAASAASAARRDSGHKAGEWVGGWGGGAWGDGWRRTPIRVGERQGRAAARCSSYARTRPHHPHTSTDHARTHTCLGHPLPCGGDGGHRARVDGAHIGPHQPRQHGAGKDLGP